MFRMLSAELRYNAVEIAGWLAILLVGALWPIVETRDVSGTTASLATLLLFLQIVTPIVSFRLLSNEDKESRLRLLHGLPVSTRTIAISRLLRAVAMPLAALLVAGILIAVGIGLTGFGYLNQLDNRWLLLTFMVASIASAFLVVLLVDILGMRLAQLIFSVFVVLLILSSLGMIQWFQELVLLPLFEFAETPLGVVAVIAAPLVVAAADVAVLRRTIGRKKHRVLRISWLD